MSTAKSKVCIIGAGPSGMAALFRFGQLDPTLAPEVVCYEKQQTWGGLWNFDWRTGTDCHGEPCHGGMYKNLWSNGPKESHELPDYTFEEHFGKPVPSYPPRAAIRDYLEGRWIRKTRPGVDLKSFIRFNTVVRFVRYNETTGKFTVTIQDFENDVTKDEIFSYVIVAVGIFNVPNIPEIPGMGSFEGRILHSKDFKDAKQFKGQRLLVIGSSYSAEDVAMQCYKYGSVHVIISWRSKPMGFKWPKCIEERPQVQKVEGKTTTFKDGTTAEVDTIVICTGYVYHFPFMEDNLRLRASVSYYPDGLYKGSLWLNGGNNKLFYSGVQDQFYSYNMFDVVGLWIRNYILGQIANEPKSMNEMLDHTRQWVKMCDDSKDGIKFQTDFLAELFKDVEYNENMLKGKECFYAWLRHKAENVLTYRDHNFASIYTGKKSPPRKPWMQSFDGSLEHFVNSV